MLRNFLFIVIFSIAGLASAKPEPKPKNKLPFPPIADSWQSLDRGLDAVVVADGKIYTFADDRKHIVVTPFGPGKTREERFGKITDSKRYLAYQTGKDIPAVRGAAVRGKKLLVMNAKRLTMISVFRDDMKELIRRTIPLDLIRPPRDRGGEPPAFETNEFRAKIKKEFAQSDRLPFAGMTNMPQSWRKTTNELLVLSRMPHFPLMILECSAEEASQCKASRGCFAHYPQGTKPQDLRGVGALEEKKWVLVGEPGKRKIHVMKFNSCYDVRSVGSLILPEKLKGLRSLTIAPDGGLVVVTDEPDWYNNASLYYWSEATWTKLVN